MPCVARCSRVTAWSCHSMFGSPCDGPMIMPAATVLLVASSIRMKLPVSRLRRYGSNSSGFWVRSRIRPISFSVSSGAVSSRCRVLTSRRYSSSRTDARVEREVCWIV